MNKDEISRFKELQDIFGAKLKALGIKGLTLGIAGPQGAWKAAIVLTPLHVGNEATEIEQTLFQQAFEEVFARKPTSEDSIVSSPGVAVRY